MFRLASGGSSLLGVSSRAMVKMMSTESAAAISDELPKAVDSAGRYANALYRAATKTNSLDLVTADVKRMREMEETIPSLSDFLKNPTLPRSAKVQTLNEVIARSAFHETFANYMMVMAENGRTTELPKSLKAFEDIIASLKGEVVCKVTTTEPLTEWELALLKKRIKNRFFSHKPEADVSIETFIDEELLGGLTIQVGDRFMDLSTRTELRKLQDSIAQSVA